jgi:hypothetical protein
MVSLCESELSVYEHSAAISNIYVDSEELVTDDYDGVVILRWGNHKASDNCGRNFLIASHVRRNTYFSLPITLPTPHKKAVKIRRRHENTHEI